MKRGIFITFVLLFNTFSYAQLKSDKEWGEVFDLIGKKQFNSLEKEAFDNQIGKTDLKFRLELLRVKGKEEIITQKYEYPLAVVNYERIPSDAIRDINFTIYGDLFSVPITTFNLDKEFASKLKSDQNESTYFSGVLVIPVKKVGDVYKLKLFIVNKVQILGTNAYAESRGKEVSLKIGDKIRLDIEKEKGNWSINPTVNGKEIYLGSDNDFFKNVDEYLVLSLENDK